MFSRSLPKILRRCLLALWLLSFAFPAVVVLRPITSSEAIAEDLSTEKSWMSNSTDDSAPVAWECFRLMVVDGSSGQHLMPDRILWNMPHRAANLFPAFFFNCSTRSCSFETIDNSDFWNPFWDGTHIDAWDEDPFVGLLAQAWFTPPETVFRNSRVLPSSGCGKKADLKESSGTVREAVLFSAIQEWDHCYYHFLLNVLPKIAMLTKIRLCDKLSILISESVHLKAFLHDIKNEPPFVKHLLTRIAPQYLADTLIVSQSIPCTGISPAQAVLTRDFILSTLEVPDEPSFAKRPVLLFMVRRPGKRHMVNWRAVLHHIRLNFESFYEVIEHTGEEAMTSQIRLFQSASVVVGPHGSGSSNILFSRRNTTLLEIIPEHYHQPCFYLLASHMQIKYAVLQVPAKSQDDDFYMEPSILINALTLAVTLDQT